MAEFLKKKWNFRVFWGFGAFRPPNSAKLFLGQPHYSALRDKKVRNFFRPPMGPNPAKPRFIEIEIEKSRFLIEKKMDPNYPKICYVVPGPLQRRAEAERIGAPPNTRQFRKNRKKKCAGTASSCDFLREKVRNSGKT